MVASALLSVGYETERYADTRRELMQATARAFAAAAASAVVERKQQETLEAIRAIGLVPGLLFVQVRTPEGRVLAALGGASHLVSDLSLTDDESPSTLELLRSGTIRVSAPVIDGGRSVGRIDLISDTAELWPRLLSTLLHTLIAVSGGAGNRPGNRMALPTDDHPTAASTGGGDGIGAPGTPLRCSGRRRK
jgi:hypothetical protein